MAYALKCDRCSNYFTPDDMMYIINDAEYSALGYVSRYKTRSAGTRIDLCPDCFKNAITYLTNPDSSVVIPEIPEEPEIEITDPQE